MCPPSSLPDCDVILEKFLLVSNLHCAGGAVITPSRISVLVFSVSAFYSFHFHLLRSSSVVTCHLVTTQKRKLGKFSDCQPGNWTSPFSVSSVSLTLTMSLMVMLCLFYRGLSHLTVLTSKMY